MYCCSHEGTKETRLFSCKTTESTTPLLLNTTALNLKQLRPLLDLIYIAGVSGIIGLMVLLSRPVSELNLSRSGSGFSKVYLA